jgi:hypothetical protein
MVEYLPNYDSHLVNNYYFVFGPNLKWFFMPEQSSPDSFALTELHHRRENLGEIVQAFSTKINSSNQRCPTNCVSIGIIEN